MANNASAPYESALMTTPSLLITRPKASADRFVARLSDDVRKRFPTVISPLMRIVPKRERPNLNEYEGVIFTSANAVEFAQDGNGRAVYCVGQSTAKRARAAGWQVMFTGENAENLVHHLMKIDTAGPLIHLAGRYRRGEIAERLSEQGKQVDVQTLYDQQLLPLSESAQMLLNGEGRIVVPLFSPRTAAQFIQEASRLENVIVVAISDAVSTVCEGIAEKNIHVAARPNGQEMIRSVEKALCDTSFA